MACVQIARSGLSPVLGIRPVLRRRRLSSSAVPFRCRLRREEDNAGSNGEEAPESLFMKELKRRGMTPTSMLDDTAGERGTYPGMREEMESEKEGQSGDGGVGGARKRNGVASVEYDKGLENQRERSMALNSEGLEGLVPRAKLLLTTGGTFFLGFGPLMLVTIGFFSALYFYFGSSFVHDASKQHVSPPPYVDPYTLLEDERITQAAPRLN